MLPTPLTTPWSSSTRFTPEERRARASKNAASSNAGSSGSRAMCATCVGRTMQGPVTPAENPATARRRSARAGPPQASRTCAGRRSRRGARRARDARGAAGCGMAVVAGMVGGAEQQLPAHAEVPHDRPLRAERQPEELAPTHDSHDARAGHDRLEVAGCCVVPSERTVVEHVDGRHARAGHRRCEPGTDDLDLGEFGHVRACSARSTRRARRPSRPASCSSPRPTPARVRRPTRSR